MSMDTIPKSLIKRFEQRRDAIGRERDKLRDLVDQYEEILGSCDTAYDDLQSVIDILSQYA